MALLRRSRATLGAAVLLALALVVARPWSAFVGAKALSVRRGAIYAGATAVAEPEKAVVDDVIKAWEQTQLVAELDMLAKSDFPISPADLVLKAKTFLAYQQGVSKPDLLSEDFEFAGPVVGPLTKTAFLKALGGFGFADAFPDANGQFHHFRVDPFDASRVWFTVRGTGTHTDSAPNPLFAKPTGKTYVNPPQSCSVRFDADGKVNQYTIGYVMDRRIGNTGGLGGIYGIAYAMGNPLPFPEARPWKMSWQYKLFLKVTNFLQKLQPKKKD